MKEGSFYESRDSTFAFPRSLTQISAPHDCLACPKWPLAPRHFFRIRRDSRGWPLIWLVTPRYTGYGYNLRNAQTKKWGNGKRSNKE